MFKLSIIDHDLVSIVTIKTVNSTHRSESRSVCRYIAVTLGLCPKPGRKLKKLIPLESSLGTKHQGYHIPLFFALLICC